MKKYRFTYQRILPDKAARLLIYDQVLGAPENAAITITSCPNARELAKHLRNRLTFSHRRKSERSLPYFSVRIHTDPATRCVTVIKYKI